MENPKYKSLDCKEHHHDRCDGFVPREYDEAHDHECSCECHSRALQLKTPVIYRKPKHTKD